MASITTRRNGARFITFVDANGDRRSIYLGKRLKRDAEAIKAKVEALSNAKLAGHAPPPDVALWVKSLDEAMHKKFAEVGLTPSRESSTLIDFVDCYIAGRDDVKKSTRTSWRRVRNHIVAFFGHECTLGDVTKGDAKDFSRYLRSKKGGKRPLAEDTARRTCGIAKQIMQDAVDRGLIDLNPFKHRDIPTATGAGDGSRRFFVSRDLAEQVIETLPDDQWRLMFALARYGGLRCPSEVLSLRWGDIDWEHGRMVVTSPKTEHHEGGESRVVPLFPELRPFLDESFRLARERAVHVITRYRKMDSNYGVLLMKHVRRAGLTTWPKPWQNLRSTRETELAEQFPMHVVCAWIGNSQLVAAKHYLQITDEHLAKANGSEAQRNAQRVLHRSLTRRNERGCEVVNAHDATDEKTPANAGAGDDSQEFAESSGGRYRT